LDGPCIAIKDQYILVGSTILSNSDLSVVYDLGISGTISASYFHQESNQLYLSADSGTIVFQYPSLKTVATIADLTSISSFVVFYTNTVYLITISGGAVAVVNTANNLVVGRWDEEGSLKVINSIVKVSDDDIADYVVSTDSGIRFI
jgi:hypothetical protein